MECPVRRVRLQTGRDLWLPRVWQLVRGDDTEVVGQLYHDVLATKVAYDAMGVVANESKSTSFRLWAHPCRTVPLIVQGRPWNTRPVLHEAGVDHVLKTLATLHRGRAMADPLDQFREHYLPRSFRLLRLDTRLRTIPIDGRPGH